MKDAAIVCANLSALITIRLDGPHFHNRVMLIALSEQLPAVEYHDSCVQSLLEWLSV